MKVKVKDATSSRFLTCKKEKLEKKDQLPLQISYEASLLANTITRLLASNN